MAIKNIICMGIGFGVTNTDYIPTLGYDIAAPPPPSETRWLDRNANRLPDRIDLVVHPFNTRKF